MKIAVLGVGSFVFGPSALHDAIVEHRFHQLHLALFDPNATGMELMAQLARRMAEEVGISVQVTTHSQLRQAIEGADFVISSAAVQVQKRFAMDCQAVGEHYPEHLITEFGGVAGISYTLRQVELVRGLVQEMRQVCPQAWLLTSSNPLPRVCEAASRLGIRAAGFCSNSSQVFGAIGQTILGISEGFAWPQAQARYAAEMAGMNHFTWLLSLKDRQSGQDVTDVFMQRVRQGEIGRQRPMSMDLMRACGKYPPNGDDHMADFVAPTGHVASATANVHGTADERAARMKLLEDVAAGRVHYRPLLQHRAWEKPMDFVAGVAGGKDIEFVSLNLPNRGQLPQLPRDVYVETKVEIRAGEPVPARHTLPSEITKLCHATAMLHSIVTDAALNHDRKKLHEAVELDPTIVDKARGTKALDACMTAHADLIGRW